MSNVFGHVIFTTELRKVAQARVANAASIAGLDERITREIRPRSAFIRACRDMQAHGIIKLLDAQTDKALAFKLNDTETIRFQFNPVFLTAQGASFGDDAKQIVTFDKSTGKVSCDSARVLALATEKYNEYLGVCTTGDVMRLLSKAIEMENAKRIMLRDGVYYIPPRCEELATKLKVFFNELGFSFFVLPVIESDRRNVVKGLVSDIKAEVATLTAEIMAANADNTLTKRIAANRINEFNKQLQQYKEAAEALQEPLFEVLKETGEAGEMLSEIGTSEQDLIAAVRQGEGSMVAQALVRALQSDENMPRLAANAEDNKPEIE